MQRVTSEVVGEIQHDKNLHKGKLQEKIMESHQLFGKDMTNNWYLNLLTEHVTTL